MGGRHVAEVKTSTALSMKNLGNVPPRLETLGDVSCSRWVKKNETYVASSVIYVPPIAGSAIRAWKADAATNMTVPVKV